MLGFLTYPTRWFWDGTRTGLFRTGLLNDPPSREPKVIMRDNLKGKSFIAFEDGYVAMDSDDREFVARCFNSFFLGLTLLTNRFADPVTEKALGRVNMNPDDTRTVLEEPLILAANFVGAHPQLRRGDQRTVPPYPGVEVRHEACGTDELRIVLRFADRLIKRSKLPIAARILEAKDQEATGNLTVALILGWTMIEQVIDTERMGQLVAQGKTRDQARNSVETSEKEVIRKLRQSKPRAIGQRDPTPLKKSWLLEVDRLRRIRNRVVHEGKAATQRDVDRMMYAADRAMWRSMRQERVDYQAFLDRIRPMQEARDKRLLE